VPVDRPKVIETTALGAAYLAGLAVGYWKDKNDISAKWQIDNTFKPEMGLDDRDGLYKGWKKAVERALDWEDK
ncbi:MAG: glycerol kinase, partial [Tepidanaerobacteraceae bacterium]|nr:glycerol kinase [Tepidanaerobacteraceae bacterium]